MRKTVFLLIGFMILMISPLRATTTFGGRGLFYVHAARNLQPGYLEFFTGTRYFGKIVKSGPYTMWDVQIATSFNIGISRHFELAVSPIVYQDLNREPVYNFPDDLYISAKLGSFGGRESHILFGGQLYCRIPTGKHHNVIYEPYAAGFDGGRLEVGLNGLVSYYHNAIFPDEGWAAHANLGYLNHNDVGKANTDTSVDPTAAGMSSEILLGAGFEYPFAPFNFSVELNGRFFIQRPPPSAYSIEDCIYLTAGVHYAPYRWVTFQVGVDLLLYSQADLSDYANTSLPNPPVDFPNYPVWRGLLGAKFVILPLRVYASTEKDLLERRASERTETLERMIKDQKDTSDAENELLRLRSERQRVEEELKRIRKLLEEEKKKK